MLHLRNCKTLVVRLIWIGIIRFGRLEDAMQQNKRAKLNLYSNKNIFIWPWNQLILLGKNRIIYDTMYIISFSSNSTIFGFFLTVLLVNRGEEGLECMGTVSVGFFLLLCFLVWIHLRCNYSKKIQLFFQFDPPWSVSHFLPPIQNDFKKKRPWI